MWSMVIRRMKPRLDGQNARRIRLCIRGKRYDEVANEFESVDSLSDNASLSPNGLWISRKIILSFSRSTN